MNNKMYEILEFDKVLKILEENALSENARSRISKLEPFLSEAEAARHLKETSEGRLIMEQHGNPPLSAMNDLEKSLSLSGKGVLLTPEQLENLTQFLTACRRMKNYLKKAENTYTSVSLYGNSIISLSGLEEEISRTIRGGHVDDRASSLLADLRRKLSNAGNQIKSKLEALLRNNKDWFSEGFVAIRNGHYTLPVKREYKNRVSGAVVDISQSGGTCFIEPTAARKLQEEMALLQLEEENEVRRILYTLTAMVEAELPSIKVNMEAMEELDFVFAKAKLSVLMKASPLPVTSQRRIKIIGGRHPLLKVEKVVPLDFEIGDGIQGVVITGPNTGGKTVSLKTIGLLSLMAQSGLHVPAEDGHFTMNNYILCDIGDGQSIAENLSTFSSHMTNIIEILRLTDDQSLVLLDELGSGTDPAEGMGLAAAIIEELSSRNCLFVATTHYPEIKELAKNHAGLINARMAFDRQSLMPMYRLELGEAGESCALYIAKRLGLSQKLIERAARAAYGNMIPLNQASTIPDKASKPHVPYEKTDHALPPAEPDSASTAIHPYDTEYMNQADTINRNGAAWSREQKGAVASIPKKRIRQMEPEKTGNNTRSMSFNIGDSVMVYPQKLIGIVYRQGNDKGEVGVQIKKNKMLINHKRLKLHVPASKLYPADYDFSIVFDSVETHKARHTMSRKHDPSLVVEVEPEQES